MGMLPLADTRCWRRGILFAAKRFRMLCWLSQVLAAVTKGKLLGACGSCQVALLVGDSLRGSADISDHCAGKGLARAQGGPVREGTPGASQRSWLDQQPPAPRLAALERQCRSMLPLYTLQEPASVRARSQRTRLMHKMLGDVPNQTPKP